MDENDQPPNRTTKLTTESELELNGSEEPSNAVRSLSSGTRGRDELITIRLQQLGSRGADVARVCARLPVLAHRRKRRRHS